MCTVLVHVQILLDHGADANRLTSDGRTTPLHVAAERGFAAIVSELVDAGADADGLLAGASRSSSTVVTAGDATPLLVAVNNAHVDCVAELLQAGADQNIGHVRGKSPVELAVLNDDVTCLSLLLDQSPGPDEVVDLLGLSIVSGAGCDVIQALIVSGRSNVEDGGTRSPCRPLMLAALKGRSDVVDLLLDCGADVDARLMDDDENDVALQRLTALQFAVSAAVDPHYKADYCRRSVPSFTHSLTHSLKACRRRLHRGRWPPRTKVCGVLIVPTGVPDISKEQNELIVASRRLAKKE